MVKFWENLTSYPLFYQITLLFFYMFYLRHLLRFPNKGTFIMPDPVLLVSIIVTSLILTVVAQDIDHKDFSKKDFIKVHLLGLIPTILASSLIYKAIKKEKSGRNDTYILLSLYSLLIVNALLSIIFVLLTIVILVFAQFRIFYMLLYASIGLLGYTWGMRLTQISQEKNEIRDALLESVGKITTPSSRRVIFSISVYAFLYLLILYDYFLSFKFITI